MFFSHVIVGDIGKQDADGFLYIVDRLKELIKYKAFQVAPASLEDILLRHESVADAGVVGIPDEAAGELPRAYVVKRPGTRVTEKDIQDFVAGMATKGYGIMVLPFYTNLTNTMIRHK